jgi:hypothetical protein
MSVSLRGEGPPICSLEPLTLWVCGLSSGRVSLRSLALPEASVQRRCRNPLGFTPRSVRS